LTVRIETLQSNATTLTIFHVKIAPEPSKRTAALADMKAQVDESLLADGAVVIRGLGIATPEDFHDCVATFGTPLDSYRGGNTPRSAITEGIFTSTEYPPEYAISLHNEMSYALRWPDQLYFCCLAAPDAGGATPVTDGRRLLADLDPAVRARFESRGVMYRQNLHGGFGLGKSWQKTFETNNRAEVEGFLRATQANFRWTADDELRVTQVRPAVRSHPVTGEQVWFNQAEQWHPSNLPPADAEALMSIVRSEEELPHSAAFGDGEPIPIDDLDHIRDVAKSNQVALPWENGDMMVIDNMLVMHGRQSYTGSRRVVVSMT
jgi:alpha-ketoglutarate-dependent taurine dioxygenase